MVLADPFLLRRTGGMGLFDGASIGALSSSSLTVTVAAAKIALPDEGG